MRASTTIFLAMLSKFFVCLMLLSFNSIASETSNLYQQLYKAQQKATSIEDENFNKTKKMLSQLKEIKPLAPLAVAPFHFQNKAEGTSEKLTEQPKSTLSSQSFCSDCHTNTPHKQSVRVRSFLNMHSKTIACQTCHLHTKKPLTYQWQNKQGELVSKIDFDKNSQYLLVPVHQGIAINSSKGSDFAKSISKQWQHNKQAGDFSKQALLWQNIHQVLNTATINKDSVSSNSRNIQNIKNIEQEQQSCTSCHQQNTPKLNLAELGADKHRQQSFEQNVIARFFSRYNKEDDKINLIELLK